MRRTVAVLLVALAIGCASPAKTDSGESGKAPAPKEEPAKSTPAAGDASDRAGQQAGKGAEFTPAQRAKMEVYWDAFKTESPTWPQLRDEWLKMGDRAKLTLTENLLRAMVLSLVANQPRFATMARTELIFLGPDIVPLVENVLSNPTYFNPGTEDVLRLPMGVQNELNELLLINETASVPSFIRLSKCEVPGVRRKALDSLGRLKDPRGIPVLIDTLQTAEHWIDRMTAARALGYGEDPMATSALESSPPERNTPSGTSDIRWLFTANSSCSRSPSTASLKDFGVLDGAKLISQ